MWRVTCAVALLVGCQNSQPAAEKKATPPAVVAPADVAPVSIDAAPPVDAAAPVDAAPADAGVDAATAPKKLVERKGEGACKVDADCELSAWQEGCCTAKCEGYAISSQLLAKRKAKENCAGMEKHVCPPPSPCPLPDFLPEKAICKRGICTAVGSSAP